MTYSIVARDPQTGDLGVAVQTFYFSVGSICTWARPGVGAVATQSMVEPAYGPRCLDRMAEHATATDALRAVRAADDGAAIRQVGVVDASGGCDVFTGDRCLAHAGHIVGDGYCVQANMMASPEVWPAMARAYEGADGDLAGRLLAALWAGQDAGGDARGQMSAAMLVVGAEPAQVPAHGVLLDIRVDHSERPLDELARLVEVARADHHVDRAEAALVGADMAGATREIDAALALLPDDGNVHLNLFATLVAGGQLERAGDIARSLIASRSSWDGVLRAMFANGFIPAPSGFDYDALVEPTGSAHGAS